MVVSVYAEIADGLGYSPLMVRTGKPYKQIFACHLKVEYACHAFLDLKLVPEGNEMVTLELAEHTVNLLN